MPSFVKIGTDEKGQRCIKFEGNDVSEKGSYQLTVVAKDTVSGIVNKDAKFDIMATQGLPIALIPPEFNDVIKVKGLTTDKIASCPKFAVDNQLAYEIVDEAGQPSDLLQVKQGSEGL